MTDAGRPGPAGREGQPGPAGREGQAGQTGPEGPEGHIGQTGKGGATGPTGPAGPVGALSAIVDLTTAQKALAAAAKDQIAATKALHAGVRKLILVVVTGIVLAAVVGFVMLRNTNSLVDLANTNKDNGAITRQNSEDLKNQLALIESVTGPDAQKRQAAGTIDILRRNAEETDCRSRRQQVRLPAPDPASPCVAQTDPTIYPGVSGEPSK